LLNNIFKALFAKRKYKSNKQRFDINFKRNKVNLLKKDIKNNNIFDSKISRLLQISQISY